MDFAVLMQACAPEVHPVTLSKVVVTESTANPYAIGVVGGRLERQPRSLGEAVATVRTLRDQHVDFSAGLGQINVRNWSRLGLDERSVFEPCRNLNAAQSILRDCFLRATSGSEPQSALRKAFSCYYSGNFVTGDRHGYVAKVVHAPASLVTDPAARPVGD